MHAIGTSHITTSHGWQNRLPDWIATDARFRRMRGTVRATLQTICNACDATPCDEEGSLIGAIGGNRLIDASGWAKSTFWAHVDELVEAGFLVLVARGGNLGRLNAGNVYGIPGERGALDCRRARRRMQTQVIAEDGSRRLEIIEPGDQAQFWSRSHSSSSASSSHAGAPQPGSHTIAQDEACPTTTAASKVSPDDHTLPPVQRLPRAQQQQPSATSTATSAPPQALHFWESAGRGSSGSRTGVIREPDTTISSPAHDEFKTHGDSAPAAGPSRGRSRNGSDAAGPRRGTSGGGGTSGAGGGRAPHVTAGDLTSLPAMLDLLRRYIAAGVMSSSQADRIRFVAAVEHAKQSHIKNPPGLLATIVCKKRWLLITQAEEDRAQERLKEFEHGPDREFDPGSGRCETHRRNDVADAGRAAVEPGTDAGSGTPDSPSDRVQPAPGPRAIPGPDRRAAIDAARCGTSGGRDARLIARLAVGQYGIDLDQPAEAALAQAAARNRPVFGRAAWTVERWRQAVEAWKREPSMKVKP